MIFQCLKAAKQLEGVDLAMEPALEEVTSPKTWFPVVVVVLEVVFLKFPSHKIKDHSIKAPIDQVEVHLEVFPSKHNLENRSLVWHTQ